MIKKFSSKVMPVDNHGVHIFFKSFGNNYSGWQRELICNAASIAILFIPTMAALIAVDAYAGSSSTQMPLLQSSLYMLVGIVLMAVAIRIATLLFNRLSAPLDWLVAPLPLLLVAVIWLIFYINAINQHSVAQMKIAPVMPLISPTPFMTIIFPIFVSIISALLLGNFRRMSNAKREELRQLAELTPQREAF
jgi:hypothetical protein